MGSNVTAGWKIHKQGALFANPCFVQIHPTCIPSSRNQSIQINPNVRVVKKLRSYLGSKEKKMLEAIRAGKLKPTQLAEEDRDYFLERRYPAFGNLVPRDVASELQKKRCDAGIME